VQRPEPAGKRDMLRRGHIEITKDQDRVAKPRRLDFGKGRVVDAKIRRRPQDLGGERAMQRTELDGHLRLLSSFPISYCLTNLRSCHELEDIPASFEARFASTSG
jgi:hypothetical protein